MFFEWDQNAKYIIEHGIYLLKADCKFSEHDSLGDMQPKYS